MLVSQGHECVQKYNHLLDANLRFTRTLQRLVATTPKRGGGHHSEVSSALGGAVSPAQVLKANGVRLAPAREKVRALQGPGPGTTSTETTARLPS